MSAALSNYADVAGALREAAAAAAAGQAGATLQDEVAGLPAMDDEASMQAEIEAHYKVRAAFSSRRLPASTLQLSTQQTISYWASTCWICCSTALAMEHQQCLYAVGSWHMRCVQAAAAVCAASSLSNTCRAPMLLC
jgi:hypothetical protein